MTTPKLLLATLILAAPIGACGKVADSSEGTAAAAGWAGAAGTTSTGGSGGAAGASSGGAAGEATCTALKRVGDVAAVAQPSGEGLFPELVSLGSEVELVFEIASGSGKLLVKGHWSAPWSDEWSPPIVGAAAIVANPNKPFATAPNAKHTTSAVLHGLVDGPCLRLATIDPQDTLALVGSCTTSPPVDVGSPLMVLPTSSAGGADSYLVGYETAQHQLYVASVGGGVAGTPWWLGCATGGVFAQGWRSPEGALVALSTSRPFDACGLDAYADGPPTRLQIARLGSGADPYYADLRHELVLPDPIVALRLAPRADGGAWIVFQTALGVDAGPIQALAVDAQGKPISGVVDVVAPGDVAPFAVAGLGNRALLVWYPFPACPDEPCQTLRFHVIDEATKLTTPPIHQEPLQGAPLGSLSLVSSPDAASVIAAWHDLKAMPSEVYAARFDCVK